MRQDLQTLIQQFARLPGLGPRSARRAVLHLISHKEQVLSPLLSQLKLVDATIQQCRVCGNFDTDAVCHICSDNARPTNTLCVVENVADLWAMERAGCFGGRYHVLGGLLSALDGIGPEDLRVESLVSRCEAEQIREVVLALSATVAGQTTAHYIRDRLSHLSISTTALAHGVPLGGELDYLDDGTLVTAYQARK